MKCSKYKNLRLPGQIIINQSVYMDWNKLNLIFLNFRLFFSPNISIPPATINLKFLNSFTSPKYYDVTLTKTTRNLHLYRYFVKNKI